MALSKLLKRVQKQFVTALETKHNSHGKYMEPDFVQETILANNLPRSAEAGTIKFFCIPYFSLENYAPLSLPEKSSLHPKRTILESHYYTTKKERDLRQAVCRLSTTPNGFCFHVSQLWCLVF